MVDRGPRFTEAAGRAVRLVDDDQVPGGQLVVAVGGDHCGQGGVGGVGGYRARSRLADVGGQFAGVGGHGDVGADWFVVECLARGADRDGGAFASGQPPGADRLGQQVQCRQQHENTAAGSGAGGGTGGDQGLAGAAGGDHARAGVLGEGADGCGDGFLLVGAQFEVCGGHRGTPLRDMSW